MLTVITTAPFALLLWQFRRRDPLTDKWVKARYRAELHESSGIGNGNDRAA